MISSIFKLLTLVLADQHVHRRISLIANPRADPIEDCVVIITESEYETATAYSTFISTITDTITESIIIGTSTDISSVYSTRYSSEKFTFTTGTVETIYSSTIL